MVCDAMSLWFKRTKPLRSLFVQIIFRMCTNEIGAVLVILPNNHDTNKRHSWRIIYNYPPKGWWIYTETQSIEVYIRCSSPTLRGIVVLVFTTSDGQKKCRFINGHNFLLLKLSWNNMPFFSPFPKQWISKDIPSYGSQSKRTKIAIHWFGKY